MNTLQKGIINNSKLLVLLSVAYKLELDQGKEKETNE